MLIPTEMPVACVLCIFSFHPLPYSHPLGLKIIWSVAVSLEQCSSLLLERREMAGILKGSRFFGGLEMLALPYQVGLLTVAGLSSVGCVCFEL